MGECNIKSQVNSSDPIKFELSKTGDWSIFRYYWFKQTKSAFPYAFEDEEATKNGDTTHGTQLASCWSTVSMQNIPRKLPLH
jgi:hypothetical protein